MSLSPIEVEVLAVVIGSALAWMAVLTKADPFRSNLSRLPIVLLPGIGFVLLALVLNWWADDGVRNSAPHQGFFLLAGLGWLVGAARICSSLNLSLRQDHTHSAGAWAGGGALLAFVLAYAGGNIGGGEAAITTFISAAISTAGLALCWLALELRTRISIAITEDRDTASGLRLAGLLVALALILGRAVAGEWISLTDTLKDFVLVGWPSMLLLLFALGTEPRLQPTSAKPRRSLLACGVAPACLNLFLAMAWILHLGWWE